MNENKIRGQVDDILRKAVALIEREGGKPFWGTTADLIANSVKDGKLEPDEIGRLKCFVANYPVLASHLIPHFPTAEWLKEAALLPCGHG